MSRRRHAGTNSEEDPGREPRIRIVSVLTGDKHSQAAGTGKQVEGRVQTAFGKAKDALRNVRDKARDYVQDSDADKKDVA